jgi:hypothetical protein
MRMVAMVLTGMLWKAIRLEFEVVVIVAGFGLR